MTEGWPTTASSRRRCRWSCRTATPLPDAFGAAAERIWATAEAKVRDLVTRHPGRFPLYTEKGRWAVDAEAWTNWCEGFLGGQLWLLAQHTGDPWFRAAGRGLQRAHRGPQGRPQRPRPRLPVLADLAALVRGRPATRRRNDVVVHAGRTLAMRFNEKGRYLRSFLAAGQPVHRHHDERRRSSSTARSETGDPDLARIAVEHCLTTRRTLVRGDGSASHEGIFDLDTGQFLRQTTQQGWRDDASWARGQGWAMYGFGTAYRYTGDRRFLDTAVACADFYLERTGDRLVPPNDWEEPSPAEPYESSAAAIAADAFWQLAGLVQDEVKARAYADYAMRILVRLAQDDFLAARRPGLGGRAQARHLPRDQEPRRRRVGDVGRLLAARRRRHDRAHGRGRIPAVISDDRGTDRGRDRLRTHPPGPPRPGDPRRGQRHRAGADRPAARRRPGRRRGDHHDRRLGHGHRDDPRAAIPRSASGRARSPRRRSPRGRWRWVRSSASAPASSRTRGRRWPDSDVPFVEGGLTPTEVLGAARHGRGQAVPGARRRRLLPEVAARGRAARHGSCPPAASRSPSAADWLAAGAFAVGIGSDLTAPGDIAARVAEALDR